MAAVAREPEKPLYVYVADKQDGVYSKETMSWMPYAGS